MLNQVRFQRFKRTTQTVLYAPHFISTMVICGMIRIFLSPSGGLLNLILGSSVDFLTESSAFRTIYIASGIWQDAGWGIIVYMASLANVDVSQYEAAKIDGAGFWRTLVSVTFPMVKGTTNTLIILGIVGSLKTFDIVKLLTGGGPGRATTVLNTYLYEKAFNDFNAGSASAIGVAILLIALVMSGLQVKLGKEE